MVDCRPEETLSTDRTHFQINLIKNVIFILLYRMSSFSTQLQCYVINFTHCATFSLNVTRCYDVAKNAATAAIVLRIEC